MLLVVLDHFSRATLPDWRNIVFHLTSLIQALEQPPSTARYPLGGKQLFVAVVKATYFYLLRDTVCRDLRDYSHCVAGTLIRP